MFACAGRLLGFNVHGGTVLQISEICGYHAQCLAEIEL